MRVMLAVSATGAVRRCGRLVGTVSLLVFLDALLDLLEDLLVAVQVVAEGITEEVLQALATRNLVVEIAGLSIRELAKRLLETEGAGKHAGEQNCEQKASRAEGMFNYQLDRHCSKTVSQSQVH